MIIKYLSRMYKNGPDLNKGLFSFGKFCKFWTKIMKAVDNSFWGKSLRKSNCAINKQADYFLSWEATSVVSKSEMHRIVNKAHPHNWHLSQAIALLTNINHGTAEIQSALLTNINYVDVKYYSFKIHHGWIIYVCLWI